MVVTLSEGFAVDWADPADAQLTWLWDQMHNPRPVVPLAWEFADDLEHEVLNSRTTWVNGYPFRAGLEFPAPPAELVERGLRAWPEVFVPRIREWTESVRTADFDASSAEELVATIEALVPQGIELFSLTLAVVPFFMGPTMALTVASEQEIGEDGPRLIGGVLQGYSNTTADAGLGLSQLAEVARRSPEVAARVKAGNLEGIESVVGGAEFAAEFQRFLDEFGWRLESWTFLDVPTWAEEPEQALQLVARYLDESSASADEAVARAGRDRDAARAELDARLSPEKREQFAAMIDQASGHVAISENRAHWQLTIMGVQRRPIMALGRKLASSGALAGPDDVWFLEWSEAKQAVAEPGKSLAPVIAERRALMERWLTLTPPPFIGSPPDPNALPEEMQLVARLFFGMRPPSEPEDRIVTGVGASRGTATGRARVIASLADSDRLEPGDVLVCVSTAAPWTPLFAVASAVVTDSGGILSHSAICAREFAIPAVVATQNGTLRIPDGAMVSVDGEQGTVRIES